LVIHPQTREGKNYELMRVEDADISWDNDVKEVVRCPAQTMNQTGSR
jgi:hypothetical protein